MGREGGGRERAAACASASTPGSGGGGAAACGSWLSGAVGLSSYASPSGSSRSAGVRRAERGGVGAGVPVAGR